MRIDVDAADVKRWLLRMTKDVNEAGGDVAEEWAIYVQDRARATVAVDTGYLRDHIEKRVDRAQMSAEVGVWDDDAYYGQFIEKGTESIEAMPFLEPAAEDGGEQIERITRAAIDRWLVA